MCHMQLAKRYYNAHALVDLCVSAVLDKTTCDRHSATSQMVKEVCIIVSTPTIIEKGVHSSYSGIWDCGALSLQHSETKPCRVMFQDSPQTRLCKLPPSPLWTSIEHEGALASAKFRTHVQGWRAYNAARTRWSGGLSVQLGQRLP